MPDDNELDRKFFELALEQHQQRQHAFFRDLWIVGAVVLVFLLLILFRFVELDDQRLQVERALAQHEADQTALMELDTRLQILSASLDPVTQHLDKTPDTLREQIEEFDRLRFTAYATDAGDCSQAVVQSPCFPQAQMTQVGSPGVTQASSQSVAQVPLSGPEAQVPSTAGGDTLAQSAPDMAQRGVSIDAAANAVASPAVNGALIAPTPDPEICSAVLGAPSPAAATAVVKATPTGVTTSEVASGAAQLPLQSGQFTDTRLIEALDGLPPEQRQLLAKTEFDTEAQVAEVNQLIEQIVDEQIVAPHFVYLNGEKDAILTTNFAAAEDAVCAVLAAHPQTWPRVDVTPEALVRRIDEVEAGLAAYSIKPPPFSAWWRTYEGKGETAGLIKNDVVALGTELGTVRAALAGPQQEIATLVAKVHDQQQQVTTALATVEAEFESVRTTFQDYAKPLPVIPVELKFAVRYFPLLLAVAIVVFVNRYRALHVGARRLSLIGTDLQLSPDIARAYLGEAPGYGRGTAGQSLQTSLGLLILAIFGHALFWFTTKTIVESEGFSSDPPGLTSGPEWFLLLYQIAGVLILVAYLLLAWNLLTQRPETPGADADSSPTARVAPPGTETP